jgi:hypothetical protein
MSFYKFETEFPKNKSYPISRYLLNGASSAMNVNGSVTNQTFSYTPPAGLISFIHGIQFFIFDNGTVDTNEFGQITALTNGLLVRATIDGVNRDIATIKNNIDITNFFPFETLVSNTGTGWLNQLDYYRGMMRFPIPLKLDQSAGDSVSIIVRDNLTGIDILNASVLGAIEV